MQMDVFKMWLDHYPFIRNILSEAMMPRVWTLQRIQAVRPSSKEFTIETNPQIISQSTYASEARISEAGDNIQTVKRESSMLSSNVQRMSTQKMNSTEQSSLSSACLPPQVK